jgi:hypothetical protein
MARETIVKRVYCKRAAFMQNDKATLQAKMTAALLKLKTVGKRKQISGDDDRYVCWRRPNFDHPCRLNFDQGREAVARTAVCG